MSTYTLKDSIRKAKFAILDIFKIRQKKRLNRKKDKLICKCHEILCLFQYP